MACGCGLRSQYRVVLDHLAKGRRRISAVRRLPARLRDRTALARVLTRLRGRRASRTPRWTELVLGVAIDGARADAHLDLLREAAALVDLHRQRSFAALVCVRRMVHRPLLQQQCGTAGARLDELDDQPPVSERSHPDQPRGHRPVYGPNLRTGETSADLRRSRDEKHARFVTALVCLDMRIPFNVP